MSLLCQPVLKYTSYRDANFVVTGSTRGFLQDNLDDKVGIIMTFIRVGIMTTFNKVGIIMTSGIHNYQYDFGYLSQWQSWHHDDLYLSLQSIWFWMPTPMACVNTSPASGRDSWLTSIVVSLSWSARNSKTDVNKHTLYICCICLSCCLTSVQHMRIYGYGHDLSGPCFFKPYILECYCCEK